MHAMPEVADVVAQYLTRALLSSTSSQYFANFTGSMLAWLFIIGLLWFVSRRLAPPRAPAPSLRERVATVLGLRLRPEYVLWTEVRKRLQAREQKYEVHSLIWSLENLENRYLYTFPLPGPLPDPESERPVIPIDPTRSHTKPELVFLAAGHKNFKTSTIMAIAQAIDRRNERLLASLTPGLVHVIEFYPTTQGATSAGQPDEQLQRLAAHTRRSMGLPGDLLFVVDDLSDWTEDELKQLVDRILGSRVLARSDATVVLVLTLPERKPDEEDKDLEWLRALCRQDMKHKGRQTKWRVTFLRIVHLGADTIIERVTETMFRKVIKNPWILFLRPSCKLEPWRLSLKQSLRDIAAMVYEEENGMRQIENRQHKNGDPYEFWANEIRKHMSTLEVWKLSLKALNERRLRKKGRIDELTTATQAYLEELRSFIRKWTNAY